MTEQPGKNRTNLWLSCLLSAALACLLVLAVYALRGIWPFGGGNIAYVDDAQYYVPGFYATWDYFHGLVSGSVSWYSGLAGTTSGSLTDWLELPYLVFLLIPRERVLEGLSLLLLAYLALIAAVCAFAAGRRFPHIGTAAVTAIALCYTLCGFVLQYYSLFSWLYSVALFPLILWGLERLLREGKWKLYAAFMTVSLLRSIYISYMVCVYVIVFSALYLLLVTPREKRGERAVRLGFSTAAALGLSAFRWLRSSAKLAGTSRFQSNADAGVLSWMTTLNQDYVRHTLLMALGLALAAAVLLTLWRDARRGGLDPVFKKAVRFTLCMLAALFIPMVLTNVDTMWHFGTYNFFPMRYGYMLPATVLGAAGLALEARVTRPGGETLPAAGKPALPAVFGALCAAAAAAVMTRVVPLWQKYGVCFIDVLGRSDYLKYWLCLAAAALLWVGAFLFLLRLRGRLRAWLVLAALLAQLGVNAYGLLGPDDSQVGYLEYSDAYIHEADALHEYFAAQEPGVFDRAKNADSCMNGGYPTIAGVSALSSSSSSCPGADLAAAELLGYSTNYFMLLDTGGTVLTDMLLGVKYILSQTGFDGALYTYADTVGATDVALANYTLRQGLLVDAGALDGYDACADVPARLNLLYGAFTGSTEPAAENTDAVFSCEGEPMPVCTLSFEVGEAQFVYFAVEMAAIRITVNGEAVAVPTYGDADSATYPSQFNNNLLCLGCFENETVTVSFLSPAALTREDVTLFTVSRAAAEGFDAAARRAEDFSYEEKDGVLTVTAAAQTAGQLLYLPLRYSADWRVTVNGREAAEEPVMGLCMGVPLEAGENTVVISRETAAGFGKGAVISALSLLLTAAYLLLARKKTGFFAAPPPAALCRAAGWLFALLCAGLVCFIYLAPVAAVLLRTLGVL